MNFGVDPEQLSRELREESGSYLKGRRMIAGLSLFSCGVLTTIALYQMGILKKLPEPPFSVFSSEKVNGSKDAYAMFELPDAFLGLASYSATACLAAMGPKDRWRTQRWIPILMICKLLVDAGMASKLTFKEVAKIKKLSFWSLLTTTSTAIALPVAIPEVRATFSRR